MLDDLLEEREETGQLGPLRLGGLGVELVRGQETGQAQKGQLLRPIDGVVEGQTGAQVRPEVEQDDLVQGEGVEQLLGVPPDRVFAKRRVEQLTNFLRHRCDGIEVGYVGFLPGAGLRDRSTGGACG